MVEAAKRPRAVVFDIDGVVADVQHRQHHLEQPRKNWAAFFAGAADDPPLVQGVERARRASEDAELVWVTGRPESLRETTLAWLEATGLPVQRVILRARRDFRPARVVKLETIRRLSRTMDILGIVDDDPEVCAALRPKATLLSRQGGRHTPSRCADGPDRNHARIRPFGVGGPRKGGRAARRSDA